MGKMAYVSPAFAVVVGAACAAPRIAAEPIETFHGGKQISLVIGTSPGGDYDLRGRMLARYMGKYIPGNRTIVPRNMPGGVGLQAANWLYSMAPKDGTSLHMVMRNMPMHQVLGGPGVRFDTAKFNWIGNTTNSPNTVATWHSTGVRAVEDARRTEAIVGAPGTATASVYYPMVMNALLGTRFRIIAGYPGGHDVNLAMERGEVGGRGSNSWASWLSTKPEWIKENKLYILVQIGMAKHPDLPGVSLLMDLARNEEDRAVLRFISADTAFSRALATTPDVPADRVNAPRRAFDGAMKDPDLLAEAQQARRDLSPDTGEEVRKVVTELINTPRAIIERMKAILAGARQVDQVKKD